jgi:hypothetical protein
MVLNGYQALRLMRAVDQLCIGRKDLAQTVPLALIERAGKGRQAMPDSKFVKQVLQ